ncbi:putative ER transporter, 6TM, N-terminal [Teratosphaeria destructans]|uniref:ER transporter, 6TM, N-terminal n=1 Tax=Teratosphaeria destructans TaxID=418781 RepID=A0A9W7W3C6_9PEZI|nr:putative ER transporter, 6TM, N-terminal [Teratosphaeria destructans]
MARHQPDAQPSTQSPASEADGVDMARQSTKQDTLEPVHTNPRQGADQPPPAQPSKLKQRWTKIGLDVPTIAVMFKGSLGPTIALAMYQSKAVATQYSTLGYLVAIMTVLSMPIMPRGKFIQNMTLLVLAVCLAAAVNLLALYSAVEARAHTTPPGQPLSGYNSSASAVLAIWLMVQVFGINTLKAAKPQFMFPAIVYSIFTIVSLTSGVQFATMTTVYSFMKRILEAFLTGFGLSTGVHFLVLPTSSRMIVFKEMTGYLMSLKSMLEAQTEYMASLENIDPVENARKQTEEAVAKSSKNSRRSNGHEPHVSPLTTPAALNLKGFLDNTLALQAKLQGDITPAKREFAIGKLESHDLTELWKLLRMVFIPIFGLTASIDILQRRAAEFDFCHEGATEAQRADQKNMLENIHFLMKELHRPFEEMTGSIAGAIMHVLLTLELVKPPKQKPGDEESRGEQSPAPGRVGFAEGFTREIGRFDELRRKTLNDWCGEHGIDLPQDFFETTFVKTSGVVLHEQDENLRERSQRQLFFALYLEYLLWRCGVAVLDLVLFADKRKAEGGLAKRKLIFPGSKTLYKWLKSVVGREDFNKGTSYMADMDSATAESIFLGKDFGRRRDPEHLPPQNVGERIGEAIRLIPKFFRSDDAAFGFRVVCATMSIGIVAFLEASQTWFLTNRLLWAMIMVAISMSPGAGQSTLNFVLRILGTVIAMVGSYIIWYIVDGHTAGALVFLWLWIFGAFYFVMKFPKMVIVAILSLVTAILIIGYELQVKKLGKAVSESNAQPAYPTYVLAPYRLATVTGGLFVAWVWTIFPYPVSESSMIREDLGATLYLLSNFYSIVHETVTARVQGTDGDERIKGTHAFNLNKARTAVFAKILLLLNNLKSNSAFSRFQIRVGGRFPIEAYQESVMSLSANHAADPMADNYSRIIQICERIAQNIALIGYASGTFSVNTHGADPSHWSNDFRRLLKSIGTTSHRVTSVLALMSSSITSGQPLPPYLEMPKPFNLSERLETIDPAMLGLQHAAEIEYSAFAVLQLCARNVTIDLEALRSSVQSLVGVTDFSFHAVSANEATSPDDSSVDSTDDKHKSA